jgi:hypothetical protein
MEKIIDYLAEEEKRTEQRAELRRTRAATLRQNLGEPFDVPVGHRNIQPQPMNLDFLGD